MKNIKIISWVCLTILVLILIPQLGSMSNKKIAKDSYEAGYKMGHAVGFEQAIDTISKIILKQYSASKHTFTRLQFTDSLVYYISHKKLNP